MMKWNDVALNQFGQPVKGAAVTVKNAGLQTSPTIYSDNGTSTVASSTVTADALGRYSFYAADGRYDLNISGAGITAYTESDIQLFDATASNSAASINTVQSGTAPTYGFATRTAAAKMGDVYSVKDFKCSDGLVVAGDGSHDDTTGIQSAIDFINAAGGGWLDFPKGNYIISASLNLPAYTSVRIKGAGINATQITVTANSVKAFNITGLATRISIEDLWIGSTIARTGCYGIYVAGTSSAVPASEIYIRHVNIQNLNTGLYWSQVQLSKIDWLRILNSANSAITGNGMYFFGVVSSRIRDVQITTTNGKIGGEYVLVDGDCDSVVLDGVEGYGGTTNVGFRFQLGAGTTGPRLTKVIDCYSETADSDGFYVSDGRDVRFIGCHAAANGLNGFEVAGGNSIVLQSCFALQNNQYGFIANGGEGGILGCTASNNSQQTDNTYGGIRIAADTTHWRVIGNRSGDYVLSLANGQAYGLTIGGSTSDYIVAKDNDLQGNKTAPVLNSSTGANNDLDYESTWTATGTGFTATVNGTGRFRREGRHVTVYLPTSLNGTSNTTAFTITGMPTDIRPARNQSFPVLITDNGVNAFGWAVVATTGTITLAPTAANNAAGWTNSGTKAIAEQVLKFSLD